MESQNQLIRVRIAEFGSKQHDSDLPLSNLKTILSQVDLNSNLEKLKEQKDRLVNIRSMAKPTIDLASKQSMDLFLQGNIVSTKIDEEQRRG